MARNGRGGLVQRFRFKKKGSPLQDLVMK
jgi:hypothetical protein